MSTATWKQNATVAMAGASFVGVMLLAAYVSKIVTPSPDVPPAPSPVVVVTDIIGPSTVPVGKFAEFSVKDIEQPHWEAIARSTTIADPLVRPDSNGMSALIETDVEGTYRIAVRGLRDGKVVGFSTTLVVGVAPQPPPPGPTPPTPVPPGPVVEGAKRVVLIRESLEPTPEMGRLIVLMQSGPIGDYFKSKHHEFESFDKDAVDETGQPSKYVGQWLAILKDTKLPAVAVVDVASGNIVAKKSLDEKPTAAQLLDLVKANGG